MTEILKSLLPALLVVIARAVLRKYEPKIIAITGTVGKTSTKDAIYTALSRFVYVRKSQKSYNSELGIPLTILDRGNPSRSIMKWLDTLAEGLKLLLLPNHYPEWLVLEVGTDHPGDIAALTKWLKPDMVVVTRLSKIPVHVEFFSSVEEVFNEKANLVRALKPGGDLILNADDEDVVSMSGLRDEQPILYGKSGKADVKYKSYEVTLDEAGRPKGVVVGIEVAGESLSIPLDGTLGEHHVYTLLPALAVVDALGESLSVAAKNFQGHEAAPGRMRIIEGVADSTLIDDTYNSSPIAVEESLRTLKSLKAKRKIAVLGDMLELGRYTIEAHRKVGALAKSSASILITVGIRSRYTAEAALEAGMKKECVFQFNDSKEAATPIKEMLKKGDVALVKGSQGVRMERIVAAIMAHPEEKEKLLVRQDEEWRNRN